MTTKILSAPYAVTFLSATPVPAWSRSPERLRSPRRGASSFGEVRLHQSPLIPNKTNSNKLFKTDF